MLRAIHSRFDEYFNDEELQIAAIVHPKFWTFWIRSGIDRKMQLQKLIDIYKTFKNEALVAVNHSVGYKGSDTVMLRVFHKNNHISLINQKVIETM